MAPRAETRVRPMSDDQMTRVATYRRRMRTIRLKTKLMEAE